jgi:hypothetical protein
MWVKPEKEEERSPAAYKWLLYELQSSRKSHLRLLFCFRLNGYYTIKTSKVIQVQWKGHNLDNLTRDVNELVIIVVRSVATNFLVVDEDFLSYQINSLRCKYRPV